MNGQDGRQTSVTQRPTTNDPEVWRSYWESQGRAWRTEPEIDIERQNDLNEYLTDIREKEKKRYPFKDITLSRADVEWLLAMYKDRRSSTDQKNMHQEKRKGLDLRGADLCKVDLRYLPLEEADLSSAHLEEADLSSAHLERAHLYWAHLEKANLSRAYLEGANLYKAHLEKAKLYKTHLKGAELREAHLEGAELREAQLEDANLTWIYLEEAYLGGTHLEGADLKEASLEKAILSGTHLEGASLIKANLKGTDLNKAHLEKANLYKASLEWANLGEAYLEGVNLRETHLEGAILKEAHLEGAILREAHLEGSDLSGAFFNDVTNLKGIILGNENLGYAFLAGVHWNGVDLSVVDWTQMKVLGDECHARQHTTGKGERKDTTTRLDEYRSAVRANRHLCTVLRDQGLNEEADYFAYRAQRLQRVVLRRQRKFGKYLFSGFLDLLAGYGYRPLRTVIIYLLVVGGFAIGFYEVTHILLAQPYPLAWYEALILSVSSFHGRGFFQPVQSLGDPVAILASIEAVFGLLIEISFIATFTQRFFGK